MACTPIVTGDRFLLRVLDHLDCQAQSLGSYGFQALAAPGSPAETALTGVLTLFIALFALRLLFGPVTTARDVVGDLLKVAIVLTLALSWPAYRTLVYNVVMHGPAEIAGTIAGPDLPRPDGTLAARLQNADAGIVALTVSGTGRNNGQLLATDAANSGFGAIALQDETTFGYARVAYLAGTIAPLAVIRLAAGLLLALAPLAAGLLLFEASRGLFTGWLRGLVLTMLGSLGVTVVLAAELAVLEPWLADAVRIRAQGYAAPSVPTELLAMTLAFAATSVGMLFVLARVAFHSGWPSLVLPTSWQYSSNAHRQPALPTYTANAAFENPPSRAYTIAEAVRTNLRREKLAGARETGAWANRAATTDGPAADFALDATQGRSAALGSSWRRTSRRVSVAGRRRDITP